MGAKLLQSCLTLCDPMGCSPPGSFVHGILQARILEWVAIPSSRGSSWARDRTYISYRSSLGPFKYSGRDWGQEEKGTTEDEMAWLDVRESEWTPGVGDGQGGLACCDSWGRKESDTTERLIWSDLIWSIHYAFIHPAILPSYIWLSDHRLMNLYARLWQTLYCKQKQREEAYPHSQGPCKLTRETNKPSLQEKCRVLWMWILQGLSSAGWPEIVWLWK